MYSHVAVIHSCVCVCVRVVMVAVSRFWFEQSAASSRWKLLRRVVVMKKFTFLSAAAVQR